jgi:cytochrome c5
MMKFFKIAPTLTAVFAFQLMGRAAEPAQTLAWDSERKELEAKSGETVAHIFFQATNKSTDDIVVSDVRSSCGCTFLSVPAKPWKLAPGESGRIEAKIDLVGKQGILIKTLTVTSSVGVKTLVFQVNIPNLVRNPAMATPQTALVPTVLPGSASGPASSLLERLRRTNNQQTAAGDRQAVFRNDCAVCHVEPTVGKMGGELFDKACGICHTAENRASMVPVLANVPGKEYWMYWITQGKEGSLMPVFSKSAGGPLTDEQITSLVEYLVSEGTPQPSL